MKLHLDVTAEKRQNRTGIAEQAVEREPEPMPLAIEQVMVGTNFTDFVIPL